MKDKIDNLSIVDKQIRYSAKGILSKTQNIVNRKIIYEKLRILKISLMR
jgi:hypothetical protein